MKWLIDVARAAQFIVSRHAGRDEWDIDGFCFGVFWPDGWKTKTGRQAGLTSGDKLGGYVGLSKDADGYHIGTPKAVFSQRLADTMDRLVSEGKACRLDW